MEFCDEGDLFDKLDDCGVMSEFCVKYIMYQVFLAINVLHMKKVVHGDIKTDNIAFMKMKLNANIKKHNLLCKVYNAWFKQLDVINQELNKIDLSILRDLQGVRMHNESYLEDIERIKRVNIYIQNLDHLTNDKK